jgi:glycosyltransferase involved in cell wall biosynthesis
MTADAVGGVWIYSLELAAGLAALGVEVVLATMGPRPDGEQLAHARAQGVRVLSSEHRLEWMDEPWEDVDRAGDWLLAVAADERPDVVHLNGYCHAALPWQQPTVVVAHSDVLSWWRAVKREDAPVRYREYRQRVLRGLRAAHALVAPTGAMLDALRGAYGADLRGSVIHNARTPVTGGDTAKEPIVLTVGRAWDEAKNVACLGAASTGLRWPVYLAGAARGPDGQETSTGDLRLLGSLDPLVLAGWFARASIYAAPARYEPFGLSILEAAQAGCALVLADIPSLRELWQGAAVFVDPAEPRVWHGTLKALIASPRFRRILARAARTRAAQFEPAAMSRRYLALYRQLQVGSPLTREEQHRCGS